MKAWEDPDERIARAGMLLHGDRITGRVNMLDNPMPFDPHGTIVAMIVDVPSAKIIRCALNRQQAKNLATKLMECL